MYISLERLESLSGYALDRLSDRLSGLRLDIQRAINEGTQKIQHSILTASIVAGVIQRRFQENDNDPRRIIAKRTYQALQIIANAQSANEHHDYESTLRLLRVHEFKAEQARYILDLLLDSGVVKNVDGEDGKPSLIRIDDTSEVFEKLNASYGRNELVYLNRRS